MASNASFRILIKLNSQAIKKQEYDKRGKNMRNMKVPSESFP